MTIAAALPFSGIMLLLCVCPLKGVRCAFLHEGEPRHHHTGEEAKCES
jgi:choline-glycine betaine transporter